MSDGRAKRQTRGQTDFDKEKKVCLATAKAGTGLSGTGQLKGRERRLGFTQTLDAIYYLKC